ncbi:uncharacterized protein LOC144624725 isoform X2 [Crassostrea virginica]
MEENARHKKLWLFLKRVEADVCIESLPTLRKVEMCPITAEDWGLAAQKKRCNVIASSQKCVSNSDEFVYHCLVNEKQNGFVDVCAPKWILTGFCGFYDTNNGRIYNDVKKDCSMFDKSPCPSRFNSSDIFKYPGCYEIRKENKKDSSLAFAEQYFPWIKSNSIVSIISLILLILFMIVLLAFALYYRKSRNKNEEDPNDTVPKESDPFINNNRSETDESNTRMCDVTASNLNAIFTKKRISKREEEDINEEGKSACHQSEDPNDTVPKESDPFINNNRSETDESNTRMCDVTASNLNAIFTKKRISKREEEDINEEGKSACHQSEDIPRKSEGARTFQRSHSIPVFTPPKKKRKRKKNR